MRSLLNSYSSSTIIAMIVGGTVVLALAGILVARKLLPHVADGPFEEMADGLRVVYELVFALILAFVIASVLDTLAAAESTAGAEATTLANIARSTQGLPIAQRIPLDQALNQYVHAVVDDEWKAMKQGHESPRASAALETLYALYQSYSPPPADGPEAVFYEQAVGELSEAASARRDRLALSAAELPSLLRVVLPFGGLLLLVVEYRPKMQLRPQLIHMGLLAAVVSFCYLLTVVLDYPFAGDIAVGNDVFKRGTLAGYWSTDQAHVLAAGERRERISPAQLAGVWNSDSFGLIAFRVEGDDVRAVYRIGQGSVVARISSDGLLTGWWCDAPTRRPLDDAGDVEWTLVKGAAGEVAYGRWRYGSEEPFKGGWDLKWIGGPEPPDLAPRFEDPTTFCRHP